MGKIYGIMTVDWEGRDLEFSNLLAFKNFRNKFPHIPIIQFLNAAYYTKKNADFDLINKNIHKTLLPIDIYGLHIHCWKSLLLQSDVSYKNTLSFAHQTPLIPESLDEDTGHDIPLSLYSQDEIKKMIQKSLEILKSQDFKIGEYFRAGGWFADENVLQAIKSFGFLLDSSALPLHLIYNKRKNNILYESLTPLWKKTQIHDRPYYILENLIEWPNNACLADYMEPEETFNIFKELKILHDKNPELNYFLTMGFHQETAEKFLPRVEGAVNLIEALVKKENLDFQWIAKDIHHLKF